MIDLTQHPAFVIAGGVLAILAALALPGTAGAAEDTPAPAKTGLGGEIFDTQEAADLVTEARAHDPLYCPREQADRDQAIQLYEHAIAAQPGARINAKLADRVAQMYGFYEDREKKIKPDRDKASQWWQRCIEFTEPNQLLWAQAQMGLASMAVVGRDFTSALAAYNRILEMNVDQIALPNWSAWPDGDSAPAQALLEQERAHLRAAMEELQRCAVDKLFYVFCRISRIGALGVLQNLVARYGGNPVGDRAAALLTEIQEATGTNPLDLLEGTLAATVEEQPPTAAPLGEPPQEAATQTAAQPAVAQAPVSRRGWSVVLVAGIALVTAGAGIVRYRHPRQ